MEGPLDLVCTGIAEYISPFLYKTGHTPNIVTTYSLACGLGAGYALLQGSLPWFIGLFIAAYIFDCADGYIARRYNLCTKFGDFYDHASDAIKYIFLAYVAFNRYKPSAMIPVFGVGLVFGFLMCIYLGCQQAYYNKGDAKEFLDVFRCLRLSDNTYKWARYFSCATLNLFMIAAIVYLEYT